MQIYSEGDVVKVKSPVVTTGTFDGVHVGHQKIIARLKEVAKQGSGEIVVLTFYPHPRMVLHPDDHELKLLSTESEKQKLLEYFGVQHLVIQSFTKQFSRLSSVNFIRDILINKIGTKKLVIGYNHHFGRNREGSFEHLKEYGPVYGFEVEEIPAKDIDNIEVSSTKIRKALQQGDIKTANTFLGYEYCITGRVVKGKQLGRELGYPTANLVIDDRYKLIPADGIYVVKVKLGGAEKNGMMSIGLNPTVNGGSRTIEVNIFEFDKEIYGEELTVNFIEKIRDEKKFENLEQLKDQLAQDMLYSLSKLK